MADLTVSANVDSLLSAANYAAMRALLDVESGVDFVPLNGALGTPTSGVITSCTGSPTLTAPALGTPASGVLTNCTGTAAGLTAGAATLAVSTSALKSATTTVDVASSTAPTSGQVLTATSGTAATWQTVAGTGDALVANPLSQFAATTSAQLLGVISDETGTGALVFATSPTLVTPALGTPASGVATNLTGTAAGLTAGAVTTNANLTGPITSTGNATAVAAQTGTGTTFVMQASPTLTTPNIGTPSAGVLTNCTFPTLNQNTTGTAAGLSATLAVGSGGTGLTALGAGLQVLRTNAGATAMEWATASGGSPGGSDKQLQYNNSSAFGGAPLWFPSANLIRQINSTNAQTFELYNTTDSDTTPVNYERGYMRWATNILEIGAEKGGTGTDRGVILKSPGYLALKATSGTVYIDFSSVNFRHAGSSNKMVLTSARIEAHVPLIIKESAAAGVDTAAFGQLWVKNDTPNTLQFTDDAGTDRKVAYAPVVASKAVAYTAGTDDPEEMYGGIIYVTAAATITLPAATAGMSVTVVTIGAVAVSVDPNIADLIYLDGTALDDGDKITNLSTAGDIAVLTYYGATGWYASTNSWTDGGV